MSATTTPQRYLTMLTPYGRAAIAQAIGTDKPLELKFFAVGDGSGEEYLPTPTQLDLRNQVFQGELSNLAVDEENPAWVIAEGYIPEAVGGFWVREVSLKDADGNVIAIGSYPATFKPLTQEGAAVGLYLRVILEVTNAAAVTLLIDPSVVLATRKFVTDALAAHMTQTNVHGATHDLMPGRIPIRAEDGTFQAGEPQELEDVARLQEINVLAALIQGGGGLPDASYHAVPHTLALRNEHGRTQVEDPVDGKDAANKRWVEMFLSGEWIPQPGAPDTSEFNHNVPGAMLKNAVAQVKFWGATPTNGGEVRYKIHGVAGGLTFSKNTGIEENEEITLTAPNLAAGALECSFRVTAYSTVNNAEAEPVKITVGVLSQFEWLITQTGVTNWNCPVSGEYDVTVIGGGGNRHSYKETVWQDGSWESTVYVPGGGGGAARSTLTLTAGTVYACTVAGPAGTTSFQDFLSATGGGSPGAGQGIGGNVGNYTGGTGGTNNVSNGVGGGGACHSNGGSPSIYSSSAGAGSPPYGGPGGDKNSSGGLYGGGAGSGTSGSGAQGLIWIKLISAA